MRSRLTNNLSLKILALIFATALWFFVAGQSTTEMAFLVPIGFHGIPKDMVVTSTRPGEVTVRVRGPKLVIKNLSASQVKVELDLREAKEGLHRYRLGPANVTVPTGVEAVALNPGSVMIDLERLLTRSVPVKVRLEGKPPRGYSVTSVSVIPETVEVVGFRKDLKGLTRFNTETVNVTGLKEPKTFEVKLRLGSREFKSIDAEKVRVLVVVEKKKKS